MLAVDSVSIQFSGRELLKDLSFVIRPGDRISCAGANGAGKSTLMKILAGALTPDSGKLHAKKGLRIGYLPQEGIQLAQKSVYQEAESAFASVKNIEAKIEVLGQDLEELDSKTSAYHDLLHRMGELQLQLDGYDLAKVRPQIETILTGLGFRHSDLDRATSEFSGGWQMRIGLAKLLLQAPDILLLDEPTNHLDLDSQIWLERYLVSFPGAILLISHDKSFMDSLTTRTFAFLNRRIEEYAGNYSFFLRESAARKEQLLQAYKAQQREIEKTEDFIRRFRAKATKASQVQSRIKQLEKIERIEIEEEESSVGFRFPEAPASGHVMVRLEKVTQRYGELTVFQDIEMEIQKGDRLAIVGVNGAGKSTFVRLLSGRETPTAGLRKPGHKVEIGYYSQDHADSLDPHLSVLQTIEQSVPRGSTVNPRTLVGAFLFRGDDVFKSVSVLSGGERSRLALAKMLLEPSNFLILDEPTNHLDMRSQEVLQTALQDFTGSYAIVSHNRAFLDPVVNKVLEFAPGRAPRLFLGNVSDYLEKKETEAREAERTSRSASQPAPSSSVSQNGNPPTSLSRKEQKRREAERRQLRSSKLKPLENEFAQVEKRIEELESQRGQVMQRLNDPSQWESQEEGKVLAQRYQEVAQETETLYSKWDSLSSEIERVEAELTPSE
ncbi:MAG: ABC-F family ATP-binding cassette domain-containing protein [Verrucomicrobiota bacterium]